MQVKADTVILGDCLTKLSSLQDTSVDLIYLDPPFFSQKDHAMSVRSGEKTYQFSDNWQSIDDYISYLKIRVTEARNKLKSTGSLFLHCDKSASHYLKVALDQIFGAENFQSEIIWTYKRWSNNKKGLLNNHQTIFFYSKTTDFKFNPIFEDYSAATNVDQIVQLRKKDARNKAIYLRSSQGHPVLAKEKKGVPAGDVWDIPFLNPKAKERTGYPTQKPILLLEKIIKLVTDPGDLVVDPFCGSGTTLLAAKLLGRKYIGIDKSNDAVKLSLQRLQNPFKTESKLLQQGRESYNRTDKKVTDIVKSLGAVTVHRNKGIDGLISTKSEVIPFKVVFKAEDLIESAKMLHKSTQKNNYKTKAIYLLDKAETKDIKSLEKKYGIIVFNDLKKLDQKINKSKSL